jgi:hypothetical protein
VSGLGPLPPGAVETVLGLNRVHSFFMRE